VVGSRCRCARSAWSAEAGAAVSSGAPLREHASRTLDRIAPADGGPAAHGGQHDDAALIAAARAGDRDALDRLLRRHHDRIAALCTRLCGNPADGADATQEALIAIVRGLPRFDGRSAFSTWSYRVATNACLDELRRRSRRPLTGLDDERLDAGVAADPTDAVPDRVDIDAALATLSVEHRTVVVLRDVCTLDYDEIAAVLDLPPGTVRSRIARGRAALARALEGNPLPPDRRPTHRT
jgi:RNA polymerase sigma-70 factor (ECF subfamily)